MPDIKIEEVFTPTSPASLTYIGRPNAEKQIKRALNTTGKQIIVYGHTGSGKTTLLYNLLSVLNKKHIITRCTRGISIIDIIYDAFHQLGSFYVEQKETAVEEKVDAGIKFGISMFSFRASAEAKDTEKEVKRRIVEIQKNPNQLAKLFGASDHLWVIEDFHKLDSEPKRELSQIMKVFMDVAVDFPNTKIIAVGAVDSARQVVHYDAEMDNRVSEINVTLMAPAELSRIIGLGEGFLNIKFESSVKEKIVAYSSGLASVTHQLCSLACENKEIEKKQVKLKKITEDDLDYAINEYVNEKSDSLKAVYELAIKEIARRKFETPKNILEAILRIDKDNFIISEIHTQIVQINKEYKGNNLRKYVMELASPERGEILRYNKNADSFSFSNPFLKGYCHIHLLKYPEKKKSEMHKEYENAELLRHYLIEEYKKFMREFQNSDLDEIR